MTLAPSKWPTLRDAPRFFGKIDLGEDGLPTERWRRQALTFIRVPYPMRMALRPEESIRRIVCHRQVAPSLGNCLRDLLAEYGAEGLKEEGLDLFGGAFAFPGGAMLTAASYGAAFSLDPGGNPKGKKWEDGMMPKKVIEIFTQAGWRWGGESKTPECGLFTAIS